ncbi:MAG: MBOAT family protein [bacterium]|nr:MBOAT family protein [bacterium]
MAVVLMIYYRLNHKHQNLFLLLASYFFYGSWDWRFTFLLLISTVVDFFVGRSLHVATEVNRRKMLLTISVCVNLGILGFFKYFNFFIDSAVGLLEFMNFESNRPVLNVILPVGISFYTFQTMSYTIDIYKKKMEPTRNMIDFALFVSFFPQLVAGPIERAKVLIPQVVRPRVVTKDDLITGLNLMAIGYFKKVAIADNMAPIVSNAFSSPGSLTSGELLTGLYAFSFQIYGDFSGYSDIARGVARLLGFELMINFNAPYLSRSITEFWRRWHISLSSWLRDYLYISLGGNRHGSLMTYRNLFLTMLLGGLWHGAAWTMVAWGAMHGIYLAVHKLLLGDKKLDVSWPNSFVGWLVNLVKIVITFHMVALTWIMFRASSFTSGMEYINGIFAFDDTFNIAGNVLFAALLIVIVDIAQTKTGNHTWIITKPRPVKYVLLQVLFISAVAAAIFQINTVVPFIYFQF